MTPLSLQLDGSQLRVEWPDGTLSLAASHLRRHCRCAECRRIARLDGEPGIAAGLQLEQASPVGSYGVQLQFSDGHDRGIYPWSYLRELAEGG